MNAATIVIIVLTSLIIVLTIILPIVLTKSPTFPLCVWSMLPPDTIEPIPRIIHQTWKTKTLPSNFERWSKSCQDLVPHFKYKLWTDEDNRNLIKDHYPWFLQTYDGYDMHIKRVDAARYFILHRYGGLYLDLDFMCLRKFEHLLKDGHAVFGYQLRKTNNEGSIANAWMASPPNHPLFHVLIHSLRNHQKKHVLAATGPNYLTSVIREYIEKKHNPCVIIHEMPLIYSHEWDEKSPEIERCKESVTYCRKFFPSSLFSTVWTHTWK
jgi:mannosyltransferase OCH1-like enzyme